ncbi:MAG: fuconate dehydratase [Actinobacteria bacterium]|nr:fuconate dehydratase [Actinomycetota bacterium]
MTTITHVTTHDLRARTSRTLAGSDAVHVDPDYSAAYAILHTDGPHQGHGMTFTIGQGNDLCCTAIEMLSTLVVGRRLSDIVDDMGGFWRQVTNHSQLRWLGPDKGVIHLATAALVNAVWDLWAKERGVPVWKLVADLSPEQFVDCIDFRYLHDAVPPDRALEILKSRRARRDARLAELHRDGYPAYITSAGWLGYSEQQVRDLCRSMRADGWTSFKTKVGVSIESDIRRCELMREELGDGIQLMSDANQVWEVPEAISWMGHLQRFDLRWIEEPTSPDDVLGHAVIRRGVAPIKVATGEHAANRVMFKQLMQAEAIDYCQIDACRLGGLNEVLAVLLLAEHFGVPVCPHAGGIGLCEYVQHISVIDYLCVSGSLADRTTEYASHLHEHFIDPARVHNGRYLVPEAPGYSIEMKADSIAALTYPTGSEWTS